jgi:hypothetical protein
MAIAAQDGDCYQWNNAPNILCYGCESCKAGVLEQIRRNWHKISVINVTVLVVLIAIYAIGCCAFRNARRADSGYPYGVNHMSKLNPRWDYYWYELIMKLFLFELDSMFEGMVTENVFWVDVMQVEVVA